MTTQCVAPIVVLVSMTICLEAQRMKIPDALAKAGTSLEGGTAIPSGLPPSLDAVLAEVDLVVRGTIGRSDSYLSDDEYEVYTEYLLTRPIILYERVRGTSEKIGAAPPMKVTLLGGTVSVGAFSYTSRHDALPSLKAGTDCLRLLKKVGDKNFIAGQYYGAFELSHERFTPLTRKQGFADEYRELHTPDAIAEIVARLRRGRALGGKGRFSPGSVQPALPEASDVQRATRSPARRFRRERSG